MKYHPSTGTSKVELIQDDALRDVDCIVHLAGANIGAKRWTVKGGRRSRIAG